MDPPREDPRLTLSEGTGSGEDADWRKDIVRARLFGSDPEAGARIGRFIVLGSLGAGGMGSVVRAYDETLDRQVAVKLMHSGVRKDHGHRMLREAQALARLSHPNVVQVYEVGQFGKQLFIAMELVAGRTLDDWQSDRPSWRQCLDVYLQAGRGLAAAHAAGMIHRDFKPSNCILDAAGRVRVLDFGLARGSGLAEEPPEPEPEPPSDEGPPGLSSDSMPSAGRSSTSGVTNSVLEKKLTVTGSVLGTVAYMAPEQMGGGETDARADQFSFCVSLYEALFGQRPFSKNPTAVLIRMAKGTRVAPAPPPPGRRVPRWLVRALARGLSAAPDDRWPSMHALIEALEHRRRRRSLGWVLAGTAVLGGGLRAIWPQQPPPPAAPPSPCRSADAPVNAAWSDRERQRVETALTTIDRPWASDVAQSVRTKLDGYAQGLAFAYHEACTATRIDNRETVEDLELRDACLDERVSDLTQRIALLRRADADVAEHAVELVVALPDLEPCADVEGLRQRADAAPVRATRPPRRAGSCFASSSSRPEPTRPPARSTKGSGSSARCAAAWRGSPTPCSRWRSTSSRACC